MTWCDDDVIFHFALERPDVATSVEDIKLLKTTIAAAKKNPVNIGVCLGKKPENAAVVMDRKRSPDALGRAAKKAGETSKVATGVLTVDGRDATFRCEGKPPSGVGKQLKAYFKSIDLPLNFILLDENGNLIAEDEGSEDDWTEPGNDAGNNGDTHAGNDGNADDPARTAWETAWAAAESRIADGIRANPELAGKLRAVRDYAMGKADEGEFAAAQKSLQTLLGLIPTGKTAPVNATTDQPRPTVDTSALEKRLAAIREKMSDLSPDALSRMAAPFKEAVAQVRQAAIDQATALIDRLEAALGQLASKTDGTPDGGGDQAKLRQAVAALRTRVEAIGDAKTRTTLLESLTRAEGLIDQNETEKVTATLKKVRQLLATLAGGGTQEETADGDPVTVWTAAVQTTGTTVDALRTTLVSAGNAELRRIATAALDGVLSAEQAAVTKAVDDWNRAEPDARATLAKAVTAEVRALRQALASSEIVKLAENNPFGVTMNISAPMTRALDQIEAAIAG